MTALYCDALQEEVFASLTANDDLMNRISAVYDQAPASADFPFITFADTNIQPSNVKQKNGNQVSMAINVWSKEPSQMEAKEIMAAVDTVLNQLQLAPNAQYDSLSVHLGSASVQRQFNEAGPLYVGRLVYNVKLYEKG